MPATPAPSTSAPTLSPSRILHMVARSRRFQRFGRFGGQFGWPLVVTRLRFGIESRSLRIVTWRKHTFRSVVGESDRVFGRDRSQERFLVFAVLARRGFLGSQRLFGGPFGASPFTPLLVLGGRRHRRGDDCRPIERDVGILCFEASAGFFVEGRSPYPDTRRRPIPVQDPLAWRLATPVLVVNEVYIFVASLVPGESEKGHDLLAFRRARGLLD